MPRLSSTLDEDQYRWVQARAEELDRSQAEILRRCIDLVRTGAVDSDALRPEPMSSDVQDTDRVEELADRVDDLEKKFNQNFGGETPDQLGNAAASAGPVSTVEPRGLDGEDAVVAWVRKHQPVERREIVAEFEHEWQELGIKGDSWWRRHAQERLENAGAEYTRNRGWEIEE